MSQQITSFFCTKFVWTHGQCRIPEGMPLHYLAFAATVAIRDMIVVEPKV